VNIQAVTQPKTDIKRESLSDAITPYLAEIAKRSPDTEKNRMVSPENIEIIRKVGFVRALLPKSMGGDERDLVDYCQGIRTLTKACPATGWVTGVLNMHPPGVLHFHKEVQDAVWGGPNGVDTIVSSSGSPSMRATLSEDGEGIIVNGKGRWSSGCDHAEWAMVGVKVPDLSDPEYPERNYKDHMFMVHKSDYEIDDTWYSTGQRGSGSKDLVFKDHFVPWKYLERQDAQVFRLSKGIHTNENDWYSAIPFSTLFSIFLPAIALGCADGMKEQFIKRQRSRKNAYTGAQGINNPAGYMRLAEASHDLDAVSVFYDDLLNQIQDFGLNNYDLEETRFMELLSKLAYVTDRGVGVIKRLFEGAGSSAIADFNPMQRYWRDAYAARLHTGSDYDTWLQHYGRSLMGLMPTPDL
jgi:alkylation response protein AidB-like acyl-CoA dehydrogenase